MNHWRNIYPSSDHEVRHGYTCKELHRLARLASSMRHPRGISYDDLFEASWHGILTRLFDAEHAPPGDELLRAATTSIAGLVQETLKSEGLARRGSNYVPKTNFYRYWWDAWRYTGSPEVAVVDRLSLMQIWPLLKPHHQDTLVALALYRDHKLAAKSIGIAKAAYLQRLAKARRAFLAAWHEHEAPSRPWRRDRPGSELRAMSGVRERERKRRARAVEDQPGGGS